MQKTGTLRGKIANHASCIMQGQKKKECPDQERIQNYASHHLSLLAFFQTEETMIVLALAPNVCMTCIRLVHAQGLVDLLPLPL